MQELAISSGLGLPVFRVFLGGLLYTDGLAGVRLP